MDEGIIVKNQGSVYGDDKFCEVLYGFDNKYGAMCKVVKGGPNPTKVGADSEKEVIELLVLGLTVAPKDLADMPKGHVEYLCDSIEDEELETVIESITEAIKNNAENAPEMSKIIEKYTSEKKAFEALTHEEMVCVLKELRHQAERETELVPVQLKLDMYATSRDKYKFSEGVKEETFVPSIKDISRATTKDSDGKQSKSTRDRTIEK